MESDMEPEGHHVIKKWYEESFTESTFDGSAGLPIRYSLQESNGKKRALIITLGRAEFIEKYQEICWDFREEEFGICLYDPCGQGKSGRLLSDCQKGHIGDFGDYVEDLRVFIEECVKPEYSGPFVVLGYSMGGPVGILLSAAYPDLVDGLILASPMLQINTGMFMPPCVVEAFSRLMCFAGKSENYVWGGGPSDPNIEYLGNVLTSDEKRFRYNLDLMQKTPGVAIGSPTFGWMHQAYRLMRKARKNGDRIKCPTAVLKAGNDMLVSRREMGIFCQTVTDCEFKFYPNAHHELMMEKNRIRNDVLGDIKKFVYRIRD